MPHPLHRFAAITLPLGCLLGLATLLPAQPSPPSDPGGSAAHAPGVYNPIADPKAVVISGHARFTVLTPELIRMEWSADGKFEDHPSFVFLNRRLPVPTFQKIESEMANRPLTSQSAPMNQPSKTLTIKTSALTLTYTPGKDDGRFTPDDLSIELTVDNKPVTWHPGLVDDQNLQGTTRTLDGAVGDKTKEPIEQGLISRSGWALVDDSTRPLFDSDDFSFQQGEKSPWPWVMQRPAGEAPGSYQDLYFFGYGHDYKRALGDYIKVAGRIPLPPRFAFGAWWSRYWAYSDQEIEGIIKGFRENDVPLDVFVIDMDWHINKQQLQAMGEKDQSGHDLGWSGYSWNKMLFPDPTDFLKKLHADGLKTSLNLHPASGIEPWETHYPEMARAMGIDPASHKYVPFDITDKKFATNYFNLIHHPLEKQGVDFWWLDWQQEANTKTAGVNPTWWLNYVHFTDQQREGHRPLLFHRWGGLGNHRYQIGFSGDTVSIWPSLAFQPWFTATAANVGYAYWSHDIGGHMPGAVDPELFTRWVQFGAFSPILRTHTTKNPDSERRIWAYPEPYSAILRDAFHLRYALLPYIYTEARRTYDTGVAFDRPLYYDWPEADQAYTSKGEYVYGSQMIVDPVVTPGDKISGLASENVWLPSGEWIEMPTGKHFTGPVSVERSYSIDQIPVFVKAGAIVPEEPPMLHTGAKPLDPLIVNVWPLAPGAHSDYSVYEDSGDSINYQTGAFAHIPITATQDGNTLRVEIGPVQGSYPGMLMHPGYEVRLPADWPPSSVLVNGKPVPQADPTGKNGWSYVGNTLTTIIPIPSSGGTQKFTVEIHRAEGLTARRAELDGFAGTMTRLRGAFDALQQTWPASMPPDILIDAMQTGDRLGYHPETAVKEIAHLHEILPAAQATLGDIAKDVSARLEKQKENTPAENEKAGEMQAQLQHRLDLINRAQKLADAAGK